MKKYNILIHNFNTNKVESYDIMPYLVDTYKLCKKKKFWWMFPDTKSEPETKEQIHKFVDVTCKSRYWAKCEYEFLVMGWPPGRMETLKDCQKIINNSIKIDGYRQLEMNMDIIVDVFLENIKLLS